MFGVISFMLYNGQYSPLVIAYNKEDHPTRCYLQYEILTCDIVKLWTDIS